MERRTNESNLFEEEDKADPGKHGGITLLSTAEKTLCKAPNDWMGTMLKKEEKISWGQAGLRQIVAV